MKKHTVFVLSAILCAGSILTGCGSPNPDSTVTSETEFIETLEIQTSSPATQNTVQNTEFAAEIQVETSVPTADSGSASAETDAAETSMNSYVNLDNMRFSINGKVYTLGQTTLQEMIDDGVPFDEDDLSNAQKDLNHNTQSQGFGIVLGEFWRAQVYTINDTEESKTTSQCYVNEIHLPLLQDKTQNILTFDFPLNMTMEQLTANAGKPTDSHHYDCDNGYFSDDLEYTCEPTRYFGSYGYTFEFMNGILDYVTLEYLP